MRRLLLLWTLALLPSIACATNGALPLGYGAKATGMGGAGIAYPQDAFASATNPAGMILLGRRGDVGCAWLHNKGGYQRFSDEPTQLSRASEELVWPEIGLTSCYGRSQSLGLAVYMGSEWRTHWKEPLITPGGSEIHKAEYGQVFITPSWAWKINCIHSVGVAINLAIGRYNMAGIVSATDEANSIAGDRILNRGNDYEWGVSARFGWLAQICSCIRVGLTYQTRTWMSPFRRYRGFIPGGDADLPSQFGVGMAWSPLDSVVIAFDAVKVFWQDAKLFENSERVGQGQLGANDGPGFGWNDQVVLKLGLSWKILRCVTVRAGYNYASTPYALGSFWGVVPWQTTDEHVTCGGTYTWRCHEFTFSYGHGFGNRIKGVDVFDRTVQREFKNRQNVFGFSYGLRF